MRILPLRTISIWSTMVSMPALTWLPTRAFISGPPPLNGTCTRSMPASVASITPKKCGRLPGPGVPWLACAGLARYQNHEFLNVLRRVAGVDRQRELEVGHLPTGAKSVAGLWRAC